MSGYRWHWLREAQATCLLLVPSTRLAFRLEQLTGFRVGFGVVTVVAASVITGIPPAI
jgi:hypothetical protein